MTAEARVNPNWKIKWLIVTLVAAGFAGLCFYDGAVKYPRHNQRVAAYEKFNAENRLDEWPAYAASQGWSDEKPGPAISQTDITLQWLMLVVAGLGAVAAFARWFIYRNRRIVAETDGVISPTGLSIPYASITELDKEDWDKRGIAIVHFDHDGKKGSFSLDDWVYRDVDQVLQVIEQQTGLGQDAVD